MNENINQTELYTKLSRLSLLMSVLGIVSCITIFPSGIYYGFLCGVVGTVGGALSRPYSLRRGSSTAAIIIGILNVSVCLFSFHGLYSMFTLLKDPTAGPEISRFISGMLDQYGVSPEVFAQIIKP